MTIKEVEEQCAMARANIRFYEQEGLIKPRRLDNGYRDYSDEDIANLKRIKLLRSLRVSMEEIKRLQEGSVPLCEALEQKICQLEQEKEQAALAQGICRVILEEQATYGTLDAQKYLDSMEREAGGADYYGAQNDTVSQVFHPLVRLVARLVDFFFYSLLWVAILELLFHQNVGLRQELMYQIIDTYVPLLFMLFGEPLLLKLFGTTPGKWLFGLRLEDINGGRPSYGAGLNRTFGVIARGLGYNLPIYRIYRLYKSFKRCADEEPQEWDWELIYTIKDIKLRRWLGLIPAAGVYFGLSVLITACALIPQHRGELTVAQFADNYNRFSHYFGVSGVKYLDENGQWAEQENSGFSIDLFSTPDPDFTYTVQGDTITEISFDVEMSGYDSLIGDKYSMQMAMAVLSFVGAQKEAGLFYNITSPAAPVVENINQDFRFTSAGVQVACNVEVQGYERWGERYLAPIDGLDQQYRLTFTMKKEK